MWFIFLSFFPFFPPSFSWPSMLCRWAFRPQGRLADWGRLSGNSFNIRHHVSGTSSILSYASFLDGRPVCDVKLYVTGAMKSWSIELISGENFSSIALLFVYPLYSSYLLFKFFFLRYVMHIDMAWLILMLEHEDLKILWVLLIEKERKKNLWQLNYLVSWGPSQFEHIDHFDCSRFLWSYTIEGKVTIYNGRLYATC